MIENEGEQENIDAGAELRSALDQIISEVKAENEKLLKECEAQEIIQHKKKRVNRMETENGPSKAEELAFTVEIPSLAQYEMNFFPVTIINFN